MINVAKSRKDIAAVDGEVLAVPKTQLLQMLAEVEVGQHAQRALTNIRSMVNIPGDPSRAPA